MTLRVRNGINPELGLPNSQVVILGKQNLIKTLKFEGNLAKKLTGIEETLFAKALQQLEKPGSVPLYLNLAKVNMNT
jgi:hypothetical protein